MKILLEITNRLQCDLAIGVRVSAVELEELETENKCRNKCIVHLASCGNNLFSVGSNLANI